MQHLRWNGEPDQESVGIGSARGELAISRTNGATSYRSLLAVGSSVLEPSQDETGRGLVSSSPIGCCVFHCATHFSETMALDGTSLEPNFDAKHT